MTLDEDECLRERGSWGWSLICLKSHNLENALRNVQILHLDVIADPCPWGQGPCLNHLGDSSRFCISLVLAPVFIKSQLWLQLWTWKTMAKLELSCSQKPKVSCQFTSCYAWFHASLCGQDVNYTEWEEENGDEYFLAFEIFNYLLSEPLRFKIGLSQLLE